MLAHLLVGTLTGVAAATAAAFAGFGIFGIFLVYSIIGTLGFFSSVALVCARGDDHDPEFETAH